MKTLNTKRIFRMTVLTCLLVMLFSMTAFAKPAKAPTNLRQKDTTGYNISWDGVLGKNIYYQVNISDDMKEWIDPDEGWHSGRTETQCYAPEGSSRYIRVRAVELGDFTDPILEENAGPWSEVFEIIARPCDFDKRDVKQTAAMNDSVTIEWPEAKGATQYVVYESVGKEDVERGIVKDTKMTLTGLKPGESRQYHVYAERVSSSGYIFRNGTGAYGGAYTLPAKPDVTFKRTGKNQVEFKWEKCLWDRIFYHVWDEDVEGYEACFQYNTGKTWKTIGKVKGVDKLDRTVNYKMTKPNNFYRARIRSVMTIAGEKRYGDWQDCYFANQPTIKSAKKSGKNIKVTWKKITGASSYTIYAGTGSSAKKAKKIGTAKASKTSYSFNKIGKTKLKKGKTYYVWVVANRKEGSKTYPSFKVSSKKCKFK